MTGYWQELDHTADLAIEVFGSDLEALFTTSAQALCALAFESSSILTKQQFIIDLTAPDVESLLIDWLNELLYLSEKHNIFLSGFTFHSITPRELSASVESKRQRITKQYIKAATFHNIAVVQSQGGFQTEIVFDI